MGGYSELITAPFDVDDDAQVFTFTAGFFGPYTTNWLDVSVLSGSGYSTQTYLTSYSCWFCNGVWWGWLTANAEAFRGQSIELIFNSSTPGTTAVDDVNQAIMLPGYDLSGNVRRYGDGYGNDFAHLDGGAAVTSSAVTVPDDADFLRLDVNGYNNAGLSKVSVAILSGTDFGTTDWVINQQYMPYGWSTRWISLEGYKGQTVKIVVGENQDGIGVDNISLWNEVPGWSTAGSVSHVRDGTDDYVINRGWLITPPIDLTDETQQVSFRWKTEGAAVDEYYIDVLSGTDFGTETHMVYKDGYNTGWQWMTVGLSQFAGQTVKIRFHQWYGVSLLDDVSIEDTVPGWTVNSYSGVGGVVTGEDGNGTFVTPSENGDPMDLYSSHISVNLLDRSGVTDLAYFDIKYTLGYVSSSLLQVYWHGDDDSTTQIFQDGASSPSTRTGFIWLPDYYGNGRFEIYGYGVRVYSLGDNVATEQLQEPFSQKVGQQVDTSTGNFGYQELDLKTNGRVPLVLERYYNGHSDQFGELGYRWSNSFDTHLVLEGGTEHVSVAFGSGTEEFFITNYIGGYYPADRRITDSLTHNGDGTYTLKTKNGTNYDFDSYGKLNSITDLKGNVVSLTYSSDRLSEVEDPDGRTLNFDYDANGHLETVSGPDEAVVSYSYDSNGDLTSVSDPEDGVRTYSYDKHRLIEADDQNDNPIFTNTFDSVNRVTEQTDAQDNTIHISYDDPDKGVTTVTDPNGNSALFYHDQYDRTTDKVDALGNTVSYVYDDNGSLQSIVDPHFNEWAFEFDSSGDLTHTEDPLGNPVSITYGANHLPTTVTDGRGFTTYITYDTHGNVTSVTDPTRVTIGTSEASVDGCGTGGTGDGIDDDSDGRIDDGCPSTINTYATGGKLTSTIDALGRTESYGYDSAGNRTSKVDGNGKTWAWTYDDSGRVTSETNPLDQTTSYEYDLFGRPILEENALGQQTTYLYDLAGHLLMVEDPLGHDTFWDYDDRGLVDEKIDADGNSTLYTYDANRNMTSVTDPTRLAHGDAETGDDCGDSHTGDGVDDDSDGYVDDGCPSTYYTYDQNNKLASVTDADGGSTNYTYDEAGQLLSEEDPIGRTTSYEYDDAGHVLQKTLPNDGVWAYDYDENGNLISQTDPLDHTTTYTYDPLNRRITTTDPLLNETDYTYDPVGQLISTLDAELNTTNYSYDNDGHLASITDPMEHMQTFGYDDAGQKTSVTDALGRVTSYDYDAAGRLASLTDPARQPDTTPESGGDCGTTGTGDGLDDDTDTHADDGCPSTIYSYDDAGRMTAVTKADGGITTYAYDPMGHLLSLTDPLRQPQSTPESGGDCGTAGTGDGLDDDSDTYVDDGCPSTIYSYDTAGRRTSMTDALGHTTDYGFDPAGQMTSMTDALTHSVLFGFDLAGQQTSVTNADGYTTAYTYDDLGNVATKTDPLDRTQQWEYDPAGNLLDTIDARDVEVDYDYYDNNQLQDVTFDGGNVSYTYDDIGRREHMYDSTGTTTWNYDAASNVTSINSPNGTVAYTYDDANDRQTMTLPSDRTFTYGYDATSGMLSSITDWQDREIDFTYDADGNRTGITRPNGLDSTYTYDLADRLTAIDHANSGGTIQSFDYTLDAIGNRTAVTSNAGTETYTLDDLNRVSSVDYPTGDDVSYTYDDNGNIHTMTVGATTTTYSYDDGGQLTSDGTNTFTYDENGNMTGDGGDSYTFDYANQLTSATVDSTTTEFAYDGDGTRSSKTTGDDTTNYLYDAQSGLPQVVDDGTNSYLQQGGAQAQIDDGSDDPSYFVDDALGSVRVVTNDSGDPTGSTDYNAFGSERTTSGDTSALGFTGQQSDPETGLTYLRARYLNPAVGRFISADTVQPNAPGTQGYNLYAYVANNPTNWMDPSGHSAMTQWQADTAQVLANPLSIILSKLSDSTLVGLPLTIMSIAFPVLICAFTPTCIDGAIGFANIIEKFGADATNSIGNWSWEDLAHAVGDFPYVPGLRDSLEDAWATAGPYIVQCALWGLAGAAGYGNALIGGIAGCIAGVASRILQEEWPNSPLVECMVWGLAAGIGGVGLSNLSKGTLAGSGCLAGIFGRGLDDVGIHSPGAQCGAWALFVTVGQLIVQYLERNPNGLPAYEAGGLSCLASGFPRLF